MSYGRPPVFAPENTYGKPLPELVAPWLDPSEALLGVVEVSLSNLIRHRLPRQYRRPKQRQEPAGCLDAVLFPLHLLFNLADAIAELVEKVFGSIFGLFRLLRRGARGNPFVGGWESQAGRFVIVVRSGRAKDTTYDRNNVLLAYTDRRVLVCYNGFTDLELLADLPRTQLARLENRRTRYSPRMDLYFADGSMAALEVDGRYAPALEAMHQGYLAPPAAG